MTTRELIIALLRASINLDAEVITSTEVCVREIKSVTQIVMDRDGQEEVAVCLDLGTGKYVEFDTVTGAQLADRSIRQLVDFLDKLPEEKP